MKRSGKYSQRLQVEGGRHAGLSSSKFKPSAPFIGKLTLTENQKMLPTATNALSESVGSLLTSFSALFSNQKIMELFLGHLKCVPEQAVQNMGICVMGFGLHREEGNLEGLTHIQQFCILEWQKWKNLLI